MNTSTLIFVIVGVQYGDVTVTHKNASYVKIARGLLRSVGVVGSPTRSKTKNKTK
jgi:hypothetical protein